MTETHERNLAQALYHASRGWASFPLFGVVEADDGTLMCSCGQGPACDRPAKHPACAHGFKDATTNEAELRAFFENSRYRNVGLATGRLSGIDVVDVDPRNGGTEAWQEFLAMFPETRTDTYTVASGADGLHLYFLHPPGQELRGEQMMLNGVDFKADGGYVVAPPSQHESGGYYRTINDAPLLPLPESILAMLKSGVRPEGLTHSPRGAFSSAGISSARQREILEDPTCLREGERDTFFTFTARDLIRAGKTPQEAIDTLGRVYDLMPDKGQFSIEKVADKIRRALNDVPEDERRNPQLNAHFQLIANAMLEPIAPVPPTAVLPPPITIGRDDEIVEATIVEEYFTGPTSNDLVPYQPSIAELYEATRRELPAEILHHWNGELSQDWDASARGLADLCNLQYGELIRYVRQTEKWLLWLPNELRWHEDAAIEVRGLIQGSVDSLKLVALTEEDDETRDNLLGFSRSMSWPHGITAVLTTLQTDHVVDQEQLNAQAQAMPTENGVIDPSYGVGHDYDDVRVHPLGPEWLFTKSTRFRHEVASLSLPRARFWTRSLDRWFPNPDIKEFAQRLMGYAVFGRGQEKAFVIAHGPRDSGKSAFFNNLAFLLRDFAVQISPEALVTSRFENEAQYGLAHIAGARLYVSSELKAGAKLNSALIKRLSSGGSDTVRARAMRQDFIDIIPQGLLAIMTNYVPQDDQLDEALWGRTIILPFEGSFPANDPETVKDAQLQQLLMAEREGILQWLVEGYANYVALGLRRPRAIDNMVASVKQEQDWATPFIGEWLEPDPEEKVLCRDVRLAYEVWCHDTGDEPQHLYYWRQTMRDALTIPKRGAAGRHYYYGWKMKRQLDTLPEGWNP